MADEISGPQTHGTDTGPGGAWVPLLYHIEKLRLRDDRAMDKLAEERELRYQQRWEAQNRAVEAAFLASKEAIAAALAAQEKAVGKQETATEKRFEGANEWRSTYGDRDRLQVPRAEYSAGMAMIQSKLEELSAARERGAGRDTGLSNAWAIIVAVAGIVIAALAVISQT